MHPVIASPHGSTHSVWPQSQLCAEAAAERAQRDAPVIREKKLERRRNLKLWNNRGLSIAGNMYVDRRASASERCAQDARKRVAGGPRAHTLRARVLGAMITLQRGVTVDDIMQQLAAKDRRRGLVSCCVINLVQAKRATRTGTCPDTGRALYSPSLGAPPSSCGTPPSAPAAN